MCARCLCWCLLFFAWVAVSGGVRLYPCGDAGYQDVEENTNLTFYCDQYTGSVAWRFNPVGGAGTTISVCSSTCTVTPLSAWTVTAISATSSSLTTSVNFRDFKIPEARYLCNTEQCGLHVFAPAEVSQPTPPVITRQDSGYTLSVSANITQVYSSRGLYSCVWQLGPSRLTTPPDLSPPAADTNNTANRTGGCDVTLSLPDTSGTYPCSVTVTPGNTQTSCGNVTISRPSPPTISCPSDFIAENTPLTCTCSTANIGQPGGRLRWLTGMGSDVNTEVISGAYDVNTLTMTWTVSRGDDDKRKFRCVNNWMMNVTAQSDYTARVAFAVRSVQLTVNSQPTLVEVQESQSTDVVFQCDASFARPSPHLVLSDDQGRELARLTSKSSDVTEQPFVLKHTLRKVRCENSAVYTCTAQNGVGKPVNSTATLRVLCDMRILRDSFSSQEDGVPVLVASTGELHFQILTTRTPDTASFLYLGPDSMGDGFPPTSGLLSADCQKTTVAYKSRCVLTAFNVTQTWIGYYNVTMTAGAQDVTFTFRLQMKKSSGNSGSACSCRQFAEDFGAGLGVGLAILLVVHFVYLLCLWRRQWRLPCRGERSSQSANETVGQREPSLETEMSTCVTDTGPYEELKHTDIGLRSEYSVMSDPTPTTSQYTPETDGGYEIPRQRAAVSAAATGR